LAAVVGVWATMSKQLSLKIRGGRAGTRKENPYPKVGKRSGGSRVLARDPAELRLLDYELC